MVGVTTVGDSQSNCELKVMKQTGKDKSNPKPKGKTFLLREEKDGVWVARWKVFPAICICPLREALDSTVVVIDSMTSLK
jgi:hypothetical protein